MFRKRRGKSKPLSFLVLQHGKNMEGTWCSCLPWGDAKVLRVEELGVGDHKHRDFQLESKARTKGHQAGAQRTMWNQLHLQTQDESLHFMEKIHSPESLLPAPPQSYVTSAQTQSWEKEDGERHPEKKYLALLESLNFESNKYLIYYQLH